MTTATLSPTRLMTAEDLLALPEKDMDRWLIDGQLREKPMTTRNRFHSDILALTTTALTNWTLQQPKPPGVVLSGEAGVILARDPDIVVGIDVAYVSAEVMARQTEATTLVEGVPTLAVEILSPSDTQSEINEKIDVYLRAGVPLVWIIDPHRRTILMYRPGQPPELVHRDQELNAEPQLPGFRVPAQAILR